MMLSTYINRTILVLCRNNYKFNFFFIPCLLLVEDSSNKVGVDFFQILSTDDFLFYSLTNGLPISLNINLTLLLGLTFSSLLFLIGLFGIL